MRQIPFRDAYLRSSLSRNCTETEKYGIFFFFFFFSPAQKDSGTSVTSGSSLLAGAGVTFSLGRSTREPQIEFATTKKKKDK